jgi:diketogulonate reductase-like aldo/keto reductase
MDTALPTLALPSGESICALGLGTWRMGEDGRRRQEEIAALKAGLDLGMNLIDTAEMYGEGGAEEIVGEAIRGRRDEVFVTSKVYPHNASRRGTLAACARSLKRMRIDCIDLYLLHWRGSVPLEETLEAFVELVRKGQIRYWGVSNFDVEDMEELFGLPGGDACATNQVLYNLNRRGVEHGLLPLCRSRRIPVTAYSPIDQGRLARSAVLKRMGARHRATAAQIALAWLLQREGVLSIPKAANVSHVQANHSAAGIALTSEDLREIDAAFPPPSRRQPLEML